MLTFFFIYLTFLAHLLGHMAFYIDYFLKHFSIVFEIFKSEPKSYVFKLVHIVGHSFLSWPGFIEFTPSVSHLTY